MNETSPTPSPPAESTVPASTSAVLRDLRAAVGSGLHLTAAQVSEAVMALTNDSVPPAEKADFLTALALKGETVDEIAAFAAELRSRAIPVPVSAAVREAGMLDIVGTGGDHAGTFNISTAAALIAAAAGVYVAKHGNRAITSRAGSADVLEALGVPIELSPEAAAEALQKHRFAFLFAPRYHPAFRAIAPARKLCAERRQRTVFNLLGPLLNPARPRFQLMGVPRPEWCEPMARVLARLGIARGLIACGEGGIGAGLPPAHFDEISVVGETTLVAFASDSPARRLPLRLEEFPIRAGRLADLAGGDCHANSALIRRVFSGEERGPRRDAVLLNAAAGLFVAGRAGTLREGWDLAAETLDSGAAAHKLEELTARG